jgi:hypothetical protein
MNIRDEIDELLDMRICVTCLEYGVDIKEYKKGKSINKIYCKNCVRIKMEERSKKIDEILKR